MNLRKITVKPLIHKRKIDLYKEFSLIYVIGKFFMVCPCIKRVTRNKQLTFYNCLNIVYYLQCMLYASFTIFAFIWEKVVPLEHIRAFFIIFASLVCIFYAFHTKNNSVKTLELLENLDKHIIQSGINIRYGKIRKLTLIHYFGLGIIYFAISVLVTINDYPLDQIFIIFSINIGTLIRILYIDQYTLFVYILKERLWIINKFLMTNVRFIAYQNIQHARKSYRLIWQLTKIINYNYGVPLLFAIESSFFTSTSYTYTWFSFKHLLMPQMLYLLTNIYFLIYLPHVCHMCIEQVRL